MALSIYFNDFDVEDESSCRLDKSQLPVKQILQFTANLQVTAQKKACVSLRPCLDLGAVYMEGGRS